MTRLYHLQVCTISRHLCVLRCVHPPSPVSFSCHVSDPFAHAPSPSPRPLPLVTAGPRRHVAQSPGPSSKPLDLALGAWALGRLVPRGHLRAQRGPGHLRGRRTAPHSSEAVGDSCPRVSSSNRRRSPVLAVSVRDAAPRRRRPRGSGNGTWWPRGPGGRSPRSRPRPRCVDGRSPVSSRGPPSVRIGVLLSTLDRGRPSDPILTQSPRQRPYLPTRAHSEVLGVCLHIFGGHNSVHATTKTTQASGKFHFFIHTLLLFIFYFSATARPSLIFRAGAGCPHAPSGFGCVPVPGTEARGPAMPRGECAHCWARRGAGLCQRSPGHQEPLGAGRPESWFPSVVAPSRVAIGTVHTRALGRGAPPSPAASVSGHAIIHDSSRCCRNALRL